jgi:Tfp pilus assembly protein PilX
MPVIRLIHFGTILRWAHRRLRQENGFTMVVALGVLTVTSLLVAATFIALQGQAQLGQDNLSSKRAYSAAQAGINAYIYNLNQNPNYWGTCANDTVATTPVPGATDGESYSYTPIYANGNTGCTANVINSLVDNSTGTIRMVFTGYAGARPQMKRGIVVSFRMNSPLDFLWYTHFEAFDPAIPGHTGCNVFYRDGRAASCNINWFTRDVMNGPMYTDDQYLISPGSTPTFGRNSGDRIESSEPLATSLADICSGNNCGTASMLGTPVPNATPVPVPSDNSELLTDAQNYGNVYSGTTTITLNSNIATVTNCPTSTTCVVEPPVDISQHPIIYVTNTSGCVPPVYDPTNVTYQTNGSGNYYGCAGDVYVSGNYNAPLTIGAADDIIVGTTGGTGTGLATTTSDGSGNPTGGATLGLVANQYVRVMHGCDGSGNNIPSQTLTNPIIDAAILALNHSFMVDNYGCGVTPGQLNLHGAIAQYYRGAVSTGSGSPSTGYAKNYNYDDRLASLLPPYLFDISNSGWHVSRETLCVPPGPASNSSTICQ